MDIIVRYNNVFKKVYQILKTELPEKLLFHSIHHTFDDVLIASQEIAKMEEIDEYEAYLLYTAVLFHDIGYIKQYKKNEEIGAQIAKEILPQFNYSDHEINRIENIIMATEVNFQNGYPKQHPNGDILEHIMCDADLDNLGRDDFFDLSEKLVLELQNYGENIDRIKWWENQYKFLSNHKYFTQSQRERRNTKKYENLQKVQLIIKTNKYF